MGKLYFLLSQLAYKMVMYHNKRFYKWCDSHAKWVRKYKEHYGMEVE